MDSVLAWDRQLFLFLNSLHYPALNPLMNFLSGQILWLPLILFFIFYSYKHHGKVSTAYFFLFLALALIATDVTSSYIFKNLFERLRPCREVDLRPLIYSFGQKCGGKYGFVSSHAGNSFAIMMFSSRILNIPKKFLNLLWLIPILVSYSRIYQGVHYPGDIMGGALVGITWGLLFSYLFNNIQGASR